MRIIITVTLFLVISIGVKAQRIVPIANGRVTDTGYIIGSLKVDSVLVFPNYRTTNTNMVLGFDSRGKAVLRINNDSLIYATRRYVDSGFNAITAGSVDSSIYSTVNRLYKITDSTFNIIDSNNTIIYGSIAALFDTLPNYVDTAQLNDSLQVVKVRDVPYVGAISDLNLGNNNILPNSIRLSTSPTGTLTNVGQLYWDVANVTPSVPLNANVTLQMGQEMYIRARNNTGVQINDGQVVYINDAQGNNPTIALANSDSVNTSEVIGVATENIADNGTGFVTTFGVVNGFNTSSFASGDVLYLNTVSGQLSNTIPTPPHNVVKVGIALNNTNNGKIFVQPSAPLGQDTTFAAPYNSDKVAPTQRSIGTYTRKIVQDTASALRIAINAKYGTSDTGRAATNIVTGGGLNKVADSLGGIIATKGSGSVTSIQLVGGTNVTITPTTAITTSGVYTISATGGGGTPISASAYQMLYKSGGDTVRGTPRMRIDTTDNRFEFSFDSTTTTVTTDPHGGIKMWGSNRMGMGAVRINDTVSIPAALQRALNAQVTSTVVAGEAIRYTNNFIFGGMMSSVGTYSFAAAAYNATIQQFNYNRGIYPAASGGANVTAMLRVASASQSSGIVCGNNAFSGGGGRGTFMFSLPIFAIGERMFFGYSSVVAGATTTDPSTFLNSSPTLGVGKDAADGELFFMYGSGVTGLQKVSTGVVPNNEDVYRVTVYISPKSGYYIQLEVLSKSGTTVRVINPTTNIPPIGNRLVQVNYVNTAATGVAVSFGIIQNTEEIY